ncbi:MAG: alanine racemase [Parahaliea sp.]
MRPAKALLDLDAARHNLARVRELAPNSRVMAVVKANAYGHGASLMAHALESSVDALAVACIEEALALREAGIRAPILLLQGVFSPDEINIAADTGFWLTIHSERQLCWLEGARLSAPVPCWLKVDTGMHRLGVTPQAAAIFYQRLLACPNSLGQPVLSTHFACADATNPDNTLAQITCFNTIAAPLNAPCSAANSAAILAFPQAHYDWVRPGYMLWGNSPFGINNPAHHQNLRPVMTLQSAVTAVRDIAPGEAVGYGNTWIATKAARIATVTIGYGDGYPRNALNGTPVLINGQRCPLAGRVSMDMITVDVSDIGPVRPGDTAVLWGESLPLAEVAANSDSIGYELLTRMPLRTPRIVASDHPSSGQLIR